MTTPWDVIVVGLGGAGLALVDALSQQGIKTLGLELRASVDHHWGCSHSASRGYRQSYEDALLRDLTCNALPLWRQLHTDKHPLCHIDGAMLAGPPSHPMIQSVQRALAHTGDPYTQTTAYPGFSLPHDSVVLWEPNAGWLDGMLSLRAWSERAERHGAQLLFGQHVQQLHCTDRGAEVRLATGQTHLGRIVVSCTGGLRAPMIADGVELTGPSFTLQRQVELWFDIPHDVNTPMFHIVRPHGPGVYGMIDTTGCLKVCLHEPRVARALAPTSHDDIAALTAALSPLLPGVPLDRCRRKHLRWAVMTPDRQFCIGPHPKHSSLWWLSGLCGHGFKMLPTLAQGTAAAIADALQSPETSLAPWAEFAPERLLH